MIKNFFTEQKELYHQQCNHNKFQLFIDYCLILKLKELNHSLEIWNIIVWLVNDVTE